MRVVAATTTVTVNTTVTRVKVAASPTSVKVTARPARVAVTARPATVKVSAVGVQGVPGPTNLYVQQAAPTFTENGLWVELNPDDSVKTFWIESGF